MIVQAAKIAELERRIEALKKDKGTLTKERDLGVKDVEGNRSKDPLEPC